MRTFLLLMLASAVLVPASLRTAAQTEATPNAPRYSPDNQLIHPDNYREWIWLSSGLGMTYGPAAESATAGDPRFDNVFVTPEAYRSFLKTGTWPDKTMLVLEIRSSLTNGSINHGGHFQGPTVAIEAHVKDEARFPGKWAFFAFGSSTAPAKQLPVSTSCYSCHSQNGAVDSTFVQFYPTLLEIAKQKGTLKSLPEDAPSKR